MKKIISILLSLAIMTALVPTWTFAVENTNELPADYVDTSNNEMYHLMSSVDDNVSLFAAGEHTGKRVDIAFVIDTTSSMSGAISSVKSSVTELAKYFEEQGVNLRMSVVEYRDITCDGENSTVVHTINHSPWHTSTAQLVETLSNLSVAGGGDTPETLLDGLGCLVNESGDEETTMRWSSEAYKFAFVLTDADYKTNNKWGYENMTQMINALNAKAISTSVITSSSYYATYRDLVEQTGGEFADINSSDFVSALKDLADNAMSNTVKPQSINVKVNAISKDTNSEVPVEGATVSLFLEDGPRYYTTDSNGVVNISLSGLSDEQIAKATVSAHKAWTGTVDKLNLRYPLFKKFGLYDTDEAERYIYELHSETIDSNGNWCGIPLNSIINKGKNNMTISEPRLLVNMSICYFEPSSTSASEKSEHKEIVKTFMSKLSKELAQSTDGHLMINKVLIGSTDERTDFYVNTNSSGSSPNYTDTTLASMADIRIEASKDERSRIHSNARVQGFFSDYATWYIDDLLDGKFHSFSNLSDEEILALNGKYSFPRIQESWNASESNYTLDDDMFVTTTHESGHYILSFYDEYMDGNGDNWTSGWFSKNKRPANAPSNFGLMDYQYEEVELSTQYDYRYLDSIGTKDYDTKQSYIYNRSCEDLLSLFLENGYIEYSQAYIDEFNAENNTEYTVENARNNLLDVIEFKANYTNTAASQKRRADYSYAELDNSKYINFDGGNIDSEVTLAALSDVPIYKKATSTNDKLAEISIDNNGNITVKPQYDENYYLYYYDSSSRSDYNVNLQYIKTDNKYVGNINLSANTTYEFYLVTESSDGYLMNTYQLETSTGSKGYLYESLDGALMIYLISGTPTNYIFTEDTVLKINGDYSNVNNSVKITTDADSKGELYSVASINSNIDYTTINWFKYDGTTWTKLDTDLSSEENMNIGARCDYAGDGTYVLMAKPASDDSMNKVTNLKYTNPKDRDGIVQLSFTDTNEDTAYYNIYYSDSKFADITDENVVMQKRYAGADSYSIDLEERNKDGYVAVVAVASNGAKSELSDIVEVNTGEADRDGDGIPDWYCDKYLLWPPSGEEKDIANSDDDSDGLTNLQEYKGGSDPTDPNDPVKTTNVAVKSVDLSKSTISVKQGNTTSLTATINPDDASNKDVQWYIDDESVATIKADGLKCTIKGVADGSTKVTVVTVDGGYTATANVSVSGSGSSSSGGGGGSSSSRSSSSSGVIATGLVNSSGDTLFAGFKDLGNVPWAVEAINALAAKKIVNGRTSTEFDPEANITRAEYCQLIVNAIGRQNDSAVSAFDDVPTSAWFYHNVAVASQLGIVSGYGDGDFGPNDPITREQMAVMTQKAAYVIGKDMPVQSKVSFTDFNDISDWAKNAVSELASAGIINGMGDGTFAPKSNATRAQAAVIIYNGLVK